MCLCISYICSCVHVKRVLMCACVYVGDSQALSLVKDGVLMDGNRRLSSSSRDKLRRGSRESLISTDFDTTDDVSRHPSISTTSYSSHNKRTLTRMQDNSYLLPQNVIAFVENLITFLINELIWFLVISHTSAVLVNQCQAIQIVEEKLLYLHRLLLKQFFDYL